MSQWAEEKKIVLEAAKKMAAKGLVVGTCGNISLRLPGKRPLLAITPSSMHYDSLGIDDIQVVDFKGEKVEGKLKPSVEMMLHIGIYKARRNVNAIMHTHSTHASAAAVAGYKIPPILEDQIIMLGGEIRLASYAPSGTNELTTVVIEALGNRNGALMANHGAIGTGRTMPDAFTACELIEKTAQIYLLATITGKINHLSPEAVKAAKAIYDRLQNSP
jgi:L-ribulose-5-phosphate 4-epimerase